MDNEHSDYSPPPPSARNRIAMYIPGLIHDAGLSPGEVRRSGNKAFYYITFCPATDPPSVSGEVRVHREDYFVVVGETSVMGIDASFYRIFESLENVAAFLNLAFVSGKPEAAMAIPQREPKRKRKAPSEEATTSCNSTKPLPIQGDMFGDGSTYDK